MQFLKQNLSGIILGICITVTVFHVWMVYKIQTVTIENSQNIVQIVEFLNNSQSEKTN